MFRKLRSKNSGFDFAAHPYSDKPLLIVSGMGRSGTTILRNCVAGHSQIDCRNSESNYIHDLMGAADKNHEIPSRIPALPVTSEQYWQLHQQFILHLIWPLDQIDASIEPHWISTYSMLDPRTAIGLAKTFPKVAIFYIIRNGIEVVSSFQAFEPFQHLSFEHVCKIWAIRRDMLQYGENQDNFFLFRYEWLHQKPLFQTKLHEALKGCGLTLDPHCLEPLDKRYHPTRFPGESAEESDDLTKRDQRWRHWTDHQRTTFVDHCHHLMNILGYPIPWLSEACGRME